MARGLALAALALAGLLCAAALGYGAYVVTRGSVAVPVTRLHRVPPAGLTPARVRPQTPTRPASPPARPAGENEDD
jgi:hypothetical protein